MIANYSFSAPKETKIKSIFKNIFKNTVSSCVLKDVLKLDLKMVFSNRMLSFTNQTKDIKEVST